MYKKLEKECGKVEYPRYDNYDAIEAPITKYIQSGYDGMMGAPITFMDKYCPEQFELLECHEPAICIEGTPLEHGGYKPRQIRVDGRLCQKTYHRLFIRHRTAGLDVKIRRSNYVRKE